VNTHTSHSAKKIYPIAGNYAFTGEIMGNVIYNRTFTGEIMGNVIYNSVFTGKNMDNVIYNSAFTGKIIGFCRIHGLISGNLVNI
jgi:hypothetical protein